MIEVIEVVTQDQVNSLGDGYVTVSVGALPGIRRPDGTPAHADDVLSMQPDGRLEARPRGTADAYERARVTSKGILYAPHGSSGRKFLLPYAA